MMQQETDGRVLQIIKLKTSLKEEEVLKIARERETQFKAIPGLIQKYYVRASPPHHFAGVYIWDSMESLQSYRGSELAASIPQAYQLIDAPEVEIMDVLFKLRSLRLSYSLKNLKKSFISSGNSLSQFFRK